MKSTTTNIILGALGIIMFSAFFYFLAINHANKVNTDRTMNDQQGYMDIVKKMQTDPTYLGDRNRMPLYPYLQSLFYDPSLTDSELFRQGKYINIIVTAVILWLLYFVVRRHLSLIGSISFVLISAFGLMVFKAGYFQAETLFYFLSFLSFIAFVKTYKSNSISISIIAGILAALTYLTKASILPGVAVLLIFQLINISQAIIKKNKKQIKKVSFATLIFITAFLFVLSPYLVDNKNKFGKYFYNVNTTFYVWYDSWEEIATQPYSTRQNGDRVQWPDVPEDQIPSLTKYIDTHDANQVIDRLAYGVSTNLQILSVNYVVSFTFFLVFYLLLIVFKLYKYLNNTKNRNVMIFAGSYLLIYFLSISWYMRIESSPRFIQSLFLPVLFGLLYLHESSDSHINIGILKSKKVHLLALTFIFVMLSYSTKVALNIYSGA